MIKLGFGTYSLMVTTALWGVLLGGIVYSHIVYFPAYLAHLPESSVIVNGPYPLDEAPFWMLIHPALILSLIISLIANWRLPSRWRLIGTSFAVYFAILVISGLYFIPELGEFYNNPNSPLPREEWLARGNRWQYLSWIRGVTMFVFIFPLLLGLATPVGADERS